MNICDFGFPETVRLVNAFSFSLFGCVLFDFGASDRVCAPICMHYILSETITKTMPDMDRERVNEKTRHIISKIPELKRVLKTDAESIFLHDPAAV